MRADGYAVAMRHVTNISSSAQMENWMQPPEDHYWSGPWEPIGVSGREVVWRRPYASRR